MWPSQDIWNNPQALSNYYLTQAIPLRPQPGVLVASIIVSILGSYATLLVLGRRTSARGWRNHGLLALAAVVFAACAIWGMHFVSMISVRLKPSPDITWYLQFDKGMTTLSLFVPIIATAMAFWLIGSELEFQIWRVGFAGVFLGLTVGLMHYSASFRLPHLAVSYTAVTVVFSLILAVVAATVALFLFFRLRSQWQDSWWKRGLCSLVLATAVCGMHYLGLGGTSYRTKPDVDPSILATGNDQSTRLTIIISVMCGAIVLICFAIAFYDEMTRRQIRNKARNIVIASASFDKTGKLLVKNDGTIPMQVIQTDADLQRVLGELDPRQPTFQWLYQLSFNWALVTPFVPRVLKSVVDRQRGKVQQASPMERGLPNSAWETLLFRSRFVEASVLLAQQLDLSVESLGAMFDRVLTTGTRQAEAQDKSEKKAEEGKVGMKGDDESSIHGITLRMHNSEGVMLFLVREIGDGHPAAWDNPTADKNQLRSADTVDNYTSRGYRMAETRFFSKAMADHFGVSKQEMDVFLSACKTYAKRGTRPVVQSGGAYLGLFGVRPTGTQLGGLDVLVYNFARHQIPAYRLPDVGYPLSGSMKTWIRELANASMGEVLRRCNEAVEKAENSDDGSIRSHEDETLYDFQAAIAVAIEALTTALRCWPTLLDIAKLSPEILEIPASDNDDKMPAQMVVLEVVLPAPDARLTPVQSRASGVQAPGLASGRHESDKPPAPFVYTPFSLFTKSQAMLLRAKGYQDFSRNTAMDLNKVYPLVPTDVAAELDAVDMGEKGGLDVAGNPFVGMNQRWGTRGSTAKLAGKGLSVDVVEANASGHLRNDSEGNALSPDMISTDGSETTYEKGFGSIQGGLHPFVPGQARRGSRPNTSDSTQTTSSVVAAPAEAVKKGLTTLVNKAKETAGQTIGTTEEEANDDEPVGPPVYSSIRNRTDGWFLRSMRDLERSDQAGALDGVAWPEK
ncbi:hypothetical protein CI109_103544 [Kwoniella shandongensis]|uniref:Uncharacterized protein n=1 Tax=Kwoniella shandongensis TaxID=1734106 RepID=A0A5M6C1C8_9TREE|nr:uncharacterized protein CI109_004554 [Kwoniella shandongensis]KAA5527019.1 hypothetical protein CI109_004554 [Kwoniella shandongensis]